ncbi:imidazolonepropionase [Polaribacter sp. HL-MS24]|uniref:imidazolonepropionase n=1 Tax=Polaribacter sp. HL-MS24 TaxID=3077735 RepID=UPI002934E693|nr:imidazolonepropionase [Polaribacter sp. HL-MS24]WOC40012.1 imidazolonepropionase [Polaribacter sp. HL-MS24]
MTQLFINIKELIQVRETSVQKVSGNEMRVLPTLKNAFLRIENEVIKDFGSMETLGDIAADATIDCSNQMILPTWCDSHTHMVYAGNRAQEFFDRIHGLSYEEIAKKGGGILNSAKQLEKTTEDELYQQSAKRVKEVIAMGTGSLEIKSGYGLTVQAEIKMLRVIKRLKETFDLPIKATFLGAHAIPAAYKNNKEGYLDLIIQEMLPTIAAENLADFIDIFCEVGYFDLKDTERILVAGKKYGLSPKIHVNQFHSFGGIQLAVNHAALSVDHLEEMTTEDIEALKNTQTMPVALPSCSFFLGIPYTPARKLIAANLPLALATDYNPGSTPSGNMNFVVATACIQMKMTPEEAINAATINGAYAMGLANQVGSISKGKLANFIITKEIPSYGFIPYSFGNPVIESVYLKGKKQ